MFITLEDETGVANLVIWPSLFERRRPLVLSASMMAARGRVQREGAVVHLVADELTDLTALLRGVGQLDRAFPVPHGRGDGAAHPGSPDVRGEAGAGVRRARGIYAADRPTGEGIRVPTRDFR